MSKLQLVDAKTLEKLLFLLDFKKIRQKGSHVFYRYPDGRTTTIPHHKKRAISRPLIRIILKEIEITVDDYHETLNKL